MGRWDSGTLEQWNEATYAPLFQSSIVPRFGVMAARLGRGSGWVPVGLAVFKTVAGRSAPSWVGSTPSHSRHYLEYRGPGRATQG